MNRILTDTLFFDLLERLDNALQQQQITTDMERKLKSRPRIFFAMNEAVKFFVSRAPVPLNALSGFINPKLYRLQESAHQGVYQNLRVYDWPAPASSVRPDGGLLRLNLDGKAFEPEIVTDPRVLGVRISSLQNQAQNTLMYGESHLNAVADLNGTQIFVPAAVTPFAQIVEQPEPVTVEAMARGKAVTILVAGSTSSGTVTVTNQTSGEDVEISLDGEEPHDQARKIGEAVSADSGIGLFATVFADEIRFYTDKQGPDGYAEVEIDPGTTGITFSETELVLEPKETESIPIEQSHQDTLAVAAFNHLLFNVASLGGVQDVNVESVEGDG